MKRFIILLTIVTCAFSIRVHAQRDGLTPEQKRKYDSLRVQMPKLKLVWSQPAQSPAAISNIKTGNLGTDSVPIKNYFLQQFGVFYSLDNAGDIRIRKPVAAGAGFKKSVAVQLHKGIPVYGSQLNLNFNNNNQLVSISGKWEKIRDANATPQLTVAQALQRIKQYLEQTKAKGQKLPDSLFSKADRSELVFFDPAVYYSGGTQKKNLRLAYYIEIRTDVFFVDAQNGETLLNFSRVNDAKVRETYSQSPACAGFPGTLVLNEAGAVGGATPDAQATNAHNFAGTVYDYYFNTHGRDSYNGTGGTIKSTVHGIPPTDLATILLCGLLGGDFCCNQRNAVWHPTLNQMIYGDGGLAPTGQNYRAFTDGLDIVAHELTHAVTQYSVLDASMMPHGLDYSGESGALNEACSDIFGSMVDRTDWMIGEDIVLAGYPSGAMRNMADPTNGGAYNPADPINSVGQGNQPHHYSNRYTGADDNGGVHINSGIINHMAFLLSEGGTHTTSGITVTGIGRDAVEKIMYRTLNGHLTPTSNFLDMLHGTLAATEEVFPGDAAKYASVFNAFLAVGICDAGACAPYAPIEGRDPVTIGLALDYSGSMNDLAEPGGRPKVEVLKDAVEIFLRTWEIFSVPGDRAGVVNFSSDVSPTSLSLQPLAGNINSIVSSVRTRPADGFTAMGGALRVALDGLSGASHPATILFTNGMQNVNPMALRSGGATGNYQIINGTPSQAYGGTSGIAPNPVDISSYGIPVHVIAIGRASGDPYHMLLSDIKNETGGLLHITNTPDMALREFYLNDLVHALSLNTIEMIDYRYTSIPQGGRLNEFFELDKGVNRAAFMMSWTGIAPTQLSNFRVQAPDGTVITPTRWITGAYYSIAVFDFPYMRQAIAVNPIGSWRMYSADGIARGMNVQVSLIVDEKDIHYKFNAATTYWAGEPMKLSARVTGQQQEPLSGLSTVAVSIKKPNTPLGHLLAKTPGSGSGPITEELPDAATIKLKNILMDNAIRVQLLPKLQQIPLTDLGSDGTYEYMFTNTDEPGLYQFTFRIKGNAPGYGVIERNKTISVILKNKPSLTRSVINWTAIDGKGTYRLSVTPVDNKGYYLGPGYANLVVIMADGKRVEYITDKLDGSYEAIITSSKAPGSLPLSIDVTGITLHNGTAGSIGAQAPGKWWFSIHAGVTAPAASFGNAFKSGWLGEIDIERKLSPHFSLELVGGYYSFTAKTPPVSNTGITGFTLYAKATTTSTPIAFYAAAGPGVYIPKSGSAVAGGSAAIGIQRKLSNKVVAELGAGYFILAAKPQNTQFATGKIGLKIRL